MLTLIKAKWIVANDGRGHTLLRDGVVVYEGKHILHVGKSFDGPVDRTIDAGDKLVCPGFIDTHVHSGHRASHRLISDTGRPLYFGQPFLEISVPKEGRVGLGDPRYLKPGDTALNAALELNAMFTVVELLRNGVTTFVEFGSQESVQLALIRQIERFGTRGYLGPGYDSGRWVGDKQGGLKRVHDPEGGLRGLDTAVHSSGNMMARSMIGSAASWCRARSRPRPSTCSKRRWSLPTSWKCRWQPTPPTAFWNSTTSSASIR